MIEHRKYKSYEDYLAHQKKKLNVMSDYFSENFEKRYKIILQRVTRFAAHFGKERSSILCLGARLGEEVKAFATLGFQASGIDLNPGKNNPYVIQGDFHNIPFNNKEFHIVYTNCLDHSFDLKKVVKEISRVLDKKGYVFLEISRDVRLTSKWKEKGKKWIEKTNNYESTIWDSVGAVIAVFTANGFSIVEEIKEDDSYLGVILRKNA